MVTMIIMTIMLKSKVYLSYTIFNHLNQQFASRVVKILIEYRHVDRITLHYLLLQAFT